MKCNDCGCNKAYRRKGLAWRLCKGCWANLLGILYWANDARSGTAAADTSKSSRRVVTLHFNADWKDLVKENER
jgi:hypothetical protein